MSVTIIVALLCYLIDSDFDVGQDGAGSPSSIRSV